jgi:hypothetical protein
VSSADNPQSGAYADVHHGSATRRGGGKGARQAVRRHPSRSHNGASGPSWEHMLFLIMFISIYISFFLSFSLSLSFSFSLSLSLSLDQVVVAGLLDPRWVCEIEADAVISGK